MKRSKLWAVMLGLASVLLFAALTGCASAPKKKRGEGAITVTDMAGREVAFDSPPERIVVINPADCEILYAIGAEDDVIGRGEYCNYPEDVSSVPAVPSDVIDPEQVIALSPDLVIMGPMHKPDENIPLFEQAGIQVIISAANRIDEVYTAIELIGAATGKAEEAWGVVESMKRSFQEIAAEAKEAKLGEKTVYFEVSPLEYGLWTAGSGTFMDELCGLLGLKNAFADISGWSEISEEQVIARDPDYIVTITMYFGEGPTPVEEILSRTGWQGMKAIRNQAVFQADADMISRPSPRLVTAAETLLDFVLRTTQSEDAA
jgi:iron complex transport system substrate-binding protein